MSRTSGGVRLDGVDLTAEQMRSFRGRRIGMVQEALDSLNPAQRIGTQLVEAYHRNGEGATGAEARTHAHALLHEVGFADAERIANLYPHQLSGGMQQRVMIAMALMARHGVPVGALAVACTAQQPGVTAAIVGARTAAQVDGWIDAASLHLTAEDLAELAAALERTGAGQGPLPAPTP